VSVVSKGPIYDVIKSSMVTDPLKGQHTASDFTLELSCKKLPLVEFWCSIKKEYLQLFEVIKKIFLAFPIMYLCGDKFSSYTSTKAIY
jgi:hypothetical protein